MGAVASAYVVPLFVVALVLFVHGIYFWRRRALLPARAMSAASLAAAVWVSGYGLELAAEGLDAKIFWCRVQYFGKAGLPLAWFWVAAQYCGYDRRFHDVRTRIGLFTIPAITLLLVWTNDFHHLYHSSFSLEGPKRAAALTYKGGAWCGIHLLYCYTLTTAGAAMLIVSACRSDRLRRYQAILLLLTSVMPLLASVMDDMGVRFIPHMKLTPVSFAAALAAGFIGIICFRMFEVVPIAWGTVFDNMSDAVLVVDFQDRIVDCNQAARDLLETHGLLDQPVLQVIGQYVENIATNSADGWRVLKTGLTGDWLDSAADPTERPLHFDTEFSVCDSEEPNSGALHTYYHLKVSPVLNRRRQQIGRIVVVRDITSRRRAEQEASRAQDRLIARQREEMRDINARKQTEEALRQRDAELAHILRLNTMSEMATLWAHEVNQPLTAIANYAGTCVDELTRDVGDPLELRYALVQIEQQAKRAGRIVNRLKGFVAKTPPSLLELDLNQLVEEVCELMRSNFQKHSAVLHLRVHDSLPEVRVDATQIQQVIINLLQNALEAVDGVALERREISIATSVTELGVQVAVADRGPGIPPPVKAEIFEPYFSTKEGGLGMGLNICQRIIQAHGGVLEVDARLNDGVVVRFTLPVTAA